MALLGGLLCFVEWFWYLLRVGLFQVFLVLFTEKERDS